MQKVKKLNCQTTSIWHYNGPMDLGAFWDILTLADAEQAKLIASENFWFALALCFGSGILTSLTPCVYPMIPITINIFGSISQKHSHSTVRGFNPHSFALAFVYVAGMCVTYSVLGLIAGMSGSLFGQALQSSFMLGTLTILFLVFALSQIGLFKMNLPASWQTKLVSIGNSKSAFGIFLMGLVAGLIVSPCVGPIIAGILAFVFESSNAFLGFSYFLSFSMGLGVLFLLIGGFSGVISQLPKSGNWMMAINKILALLLFIAAGYYGILWMKQIGVIKRTIPVAGQTANGLTWQGDEKKALAMAKETNSPILLDFSAEWCESCKELDHILFQDQKVLTKMKQFIPLRIDVTNDSPENTEILRKYGVMSLPAIIFVQPDGKTLKKPRIHGLISVERFLEALSQVSP